MAERLTELAERLVNWEDGTKGHRHYFVYDRYFTEFADRAISLLELGVWRGDSTRVFASYFGNGKIIAVDHEDRNIDFSGYPNVVFERGDQRDGDRLREICAKHAPGGLDIVIDDASHIGAWSLLSYQALLPLLKPDGLYIVEDWGTGYFDDWPDGRQLAEPRRRWWSRKGRIPTHDFGMVGFLKSTFEDVAARIAPNSQAAETRTQQLEFVHVYSNFAVLKKFAPSKQA